MAATIFIAFIYLTPFIPLPLLKGRGNGYVREASPLFDSPVSISLLQRRGGKNIRRGVSPLLNAPII